MASVSYITSYHYGTLSRVSSHRQNDPGLVPVDAYDSCFHRLVKYKVYADGFIGQDLGSSAAQSVILLVLVGLLTIIQFKYIEKKVHY